MKVLQTFALPLGHATIWSGVSARFGAADEARTRYLHLGKVALYQMSYGRMPTHLTLRPPCMGASFAEVGFVGDPDRARTDDPQRDRLVL